MLSPGCTTDDKGMKKNHSYPATYLLVSAYQLEKALITNQDIETNKENIEKILLDMINHASLFYGIKLKEKLSKLDNHLF